MHPLRTYIILPIIAALAISLSSCDAQLRNQPDIGTNGFLNDSCYQSLLVVEPEESSRGLVARRESASRNAKQADLAALALENLVDFVIDARQKAGLADRNRKDVDPAAHRARVTERVRGLARGGRTVFSFYNDSNAMVIGYTMCSIGFRKKLEEILKTPEETGK